MLVVVALALSIVSTYSEYADSFVYGLASKPGTYKRALARPDSFELGSLCSEAKPGAAVCERGCELVKQRAVAKAGDLQGRPSKAAVRAAERASSLCRDVCRQPRRSCSEAGAPKCPKAAPRKPCSEGCLLAVEEMANDPKVGLTKARAESERAQCSAICNATCPKRPPPEKPCGPKCRKRAAEELELLFGRHTGTDLPQGNSGPTEPVF